jgi:hypothetical protein
MNGSAVPGTPGAPDPTLRVLSGPAALADCAALLDAAPGFFLTAAWWRSVLAAGIPPDGEARFLLAMRNETEAALFPMLSLRGSLASLTNPYTCLYQPLLAPGLDDMALLALGRAFGRYCAAWPAVRLEALDRTATLDLLLEGVRQTGLRTLPFDHFGNWHEAVAGMGWQDYLRARPGALRETLRRKLRQGGLDLDTITSPADIEAGIAAYEDIYARSWKVPEPYPRFNPVMMREAAAQGMLRLGLLRQRGKPIAAQIWIVMQGRATVVKLAHDEAFKSLSPGTVLTAMMIRSLLEAGDVTELDFGRGDDAYKRLWTSRRAQRIGVELVNPRRLRGAALLGRHWLKRVVAPLRRAARPPSPEDARP